jgi:hypothetical protein
VSAREAAFRLSHRARLVYRQPELTDPVRMPRAEAREADLLRRSAKARTVLRNCQASVI